VSQRRPRFKRAKTRHFELTERDRSILADVERFGLLTSADIEALYPEGSPQNLRRRLQLLFHAKYLDRPRSPLTEGNQPFVYSIGSAGASLLAAKPFRPPRVHFAHRLALARVLASFEASCRKHGSVRMIGWEEILAERVPEERRRVRDPSRWRVGVPGEGAVGIAPDAIFGLHYTELPAGRNRSFFFLEVDLASMPVRRKTKGTSIERKLLGYRETLRKELHTRFFGFRTFRVLIVSESPAGKRLTTIRRAAERLYGLEGRVLFANFASVVGGDALSLEWEQAAHENSRLGTRQG